MREFLGALALQGGYNTTLVMVGAALLGAAGGGVGAFALLRRRSLASDAMSHATLPGIVLAFMIGHAVLGEGRFVWLLLMGAALTAGLGLWVTTLIAARTRLREDAAIGIVLSTFFAAGVVLLTVVQSLNLPGQAGLQGYLLGSTAGMLRAEAELIAAAAAVVAGAVFALRNLFIVTAFDEGFAAARGVNTVRLDFALLILVLAVVVIGLKAAGVVLVIALTIIPPVTARLWTDRARDMALIAAGLGAAGAYVGAGLSATVPNLPTGAVIVLVQFAVFALSLALAPRRGLVAAAVRRARLVREIKSGRWRPASAEGGA
ncbi:MAG: metal ABC transporter permease [Hyphomicrobiales bacterium]|nr:metal ABC transporter permease [Hyphomicrobiales bacterium]